jgi:ribosome-associated protein
MLFESSLKICCYTSIEMTFFVFNNIHKPRLLIHVMIITTMDRIKIPFSELEFSFARSSGAGGQHINKVNSKVIMTWKTDQTQACSQEIFHRFQEKYGQFFLDNGDVQVVSQKTRSQKSNMDDCIEKLHAMLNDVRCPPKVRKKTRPKRSAVLKRLTSKKLEGEKKRMRRKDF